MLNNSFNSIGLGGIYTGSVPFGTIPEWVRLGPAFKQDPLELFQMELLALPKWAHLQSQPHLEQFPEGLL